MNEPRFNDYREITAKYAGKSTACGSKVGGHEITIGDLIGHWFGKGGISPTKTMCAACWSSWCCENQAADYDEAMMGGASW